MLRKLQVLVPGEEKRPGKPPYDSGETLGGRTDVGTSTQNAGVAFPIAVRAVDKYWNRISTNATVFLSSPAAGWITGEVLYVAGGQQNYGKNQALVDEKLGRPKA